MSYSYDAVRARVQNITKRTGLKSDVVCQRYFLERFIARMAPTMIHNIFHIFILSSVKSL